MINSMDTTSLIVDIHTHPTLRAYNSRFPEGQRNLWDKTYNERPQTSLGRWASLKSREIAKESQANLRSYATAKARVVFDSLYPLEKGFLNFRKVPSLMVGRNGADQVLRSVTGYEDHQLRSLRSNNDYFQELLGQYAFLSKGQGPSPCGQHAYKLAANWSEVESILRADDHTIAVLVTIEGAHAFNCGLPRRGTYSGLNVDCLRENIGTVKSWRYAPFFVNLSHHFYNELCGHARSLKPGIYQAVNQKEGIGAGLTEAGETVIYELLSRNNGRRILIDIKHMSVRGRKEYYRMLDAHNRLNPQDQIPVICSHTGMNEFETMRASRQRKDKPRKSKHSYFHNWAINLSAEEIRYIHQSGGLIGIMVDKGLLGSLNTLEEIKALKDPLQRKDAFVELVASNLFHAVQAVGKKSAWDILSLGTDYDGMIAHIDSYPDAASLPHLREDLVDFIERKQYGKELWYGMEPTELISKVMAGNALTFMQKHF